MTARLARVVGLLANRLHASRDAEARAWGWQVTRTPWGGRTYRDPRVARLAAQRLTVPARLSGRIGVQVASLMLVAVTAGCQDLPTIGTADAGTTGAGGTAAGGSNSLPAIAAHIRQCESGGNYRAQNAHSTASGAYQFINATWTGVTHLAPPARAYSPAVQDRAFITLWAGGAGAHNWDASRSCWGRYWTGR